MSGCCFLGTCANCHRYSIDLLTCGFLLCGLQNSRRTSKEHLNTLKREVRGQVRVIQLGQRAYGTSCGGCDIQVEILKVNLRYPSGRWQEQLTWWWQGARHIQRTDGYSTGQKDRMKGWEGVCWAMKLGVFFHIKYGFWELYGRVIIWSTVSYHIWVKDSHQKTFHLTGCTFFKVPIFYIVFHNYAATLMLGVGLEASVHKPITVRLSHWGSAKLATGWSHLRWWVERQQLAQA